MRGKNSMASQMSRWKSSGKEMKTLKTCSRPETAFDIKCLTEPRRMNRLSNRFTE